MKYFISFVLLCSFAFAELQVVQVVEKANNLFLVNDSFYIQTKNCSSGYDFHDNVDGEAYYDAEDGKLILSKITCDVIKTFNYERRESQ